LRQRPFAMTERLQRDLLTNTGLPSVLFIVLTLNRLRPRHSACISSGGCVLRDSRAEPLQLWQLPLFAGMLADENPIACILHYSKKPTACILHYITCEPASAPCSVMLADARPEKHDYHPIASSAAVRFSIATAVPEFPRHSTVVACGQPIALHGSQHTEAAAHCVLYAVHEQRKQCNATKRRKKASTIHHMKLRILRPGSRSLLSQRH